MDVSVELPILYQQVLLALAALLIDAVLGSVAILGRLPGPDSLLRVLLSFVISLRPAESAKPAILAVFGGVTMVGMVMLAAVSGYWLDRLVDSEIGSKGGIQIVLVLLLALLLGQRAVVDTARQLASRLESPVSRGAEGRHAAARWTIERLAYRVSDGLIANLFWLSLGGFTALLSFRALSVFAAVGSPAGIRRSGSPFYWLGEVCYWGAGLPAAVISGVVFAIAGLVVAPGSVFASLGFLAARPFAGSFPLRLWPIQALTEILGVAVKSAPGSARPDSEWVGASGGRARARPEDVRKAILVVVAAWLLVLLGLGALVLHGLG